MSFTNEARWDVMQDWGEAAWTDPWGFHRAVAERLHEMLHEPVVFGHGVSMRRMPRYLLRRSCLPIRVG